MELITVIVAETLAKRIFKAIISTRLVLDYYIMNRKHCHTKTFYEALSKVIVVLSRDP